MACVQTFAPLTTLRILSELTRLGFVSYQSQRSTSDRGYWICEMEPPQPCILACPTIIDAGGNDETGSIALMIFPDDHLVLHCGYTGMVEYPEPELGLESAVQEAERFIAGL
jgi:hypothetical protein